MFFRQILVHKKALFVIFVHFIIDNTVDCNKDCWKRYDAVQLFDVMHKIDEQHGDVKYTMEGLIKETDSILQKKFLDHHGRAIREDFKVLNNGTHIPTGINLGGYSTLRLPKSLLFFHRLMLHEHQASKFRLTSLKTCMFNLQIQAHMKLYDLHLFGSYDYANILNEPRILSCEPTFGQVELILKNVSYKIDARTRFLKQKLFLQLIISELDLDEVLMEYGNKESSQQKHSVSLQRKNIDAFIDRLKVDLDKWMKDYLNDIILNYVADFPKDARYEEYHQNRTTALNLYADKVIKKLRERMMKTNSTAIDLPTYEIRSMDVANLTLISGELRHLDSIYRRSIATGVKHDDSDVYNVNTLVGFSKLKLTYRINATLNSLVAPVQGFLLLTANDITARMDLSLTKHSETVDLSFTFLEQTKPESLIISNDIISNIPNIKYILEHHIIAIMTDNLVDNIQKLGTLDRCVPH